MKRFWFVLAISIVIGALGGVAIQSFLPDLALAIEDVGLLRLLIAGGLSLLLSFFLHIVIHESGHLVLGLFSGYHFVSFRIFNLMVARNAQGSVEFKTFNVMGTGGQCLMAPPAYDPQAFPYKRYLLGGILANGLACLLCAGLGGLGSLFGTIFFFIGLFVVITNGIPMQFNDGKSLQLAMRSQENRYLLYNSLKVNELLAQGLSYTQIPSELFEPVPPMPEYTYFNTQHELICVNRSLEALDFTKAKVLLEELWQKREEIAFPVFVAGITGELLALLCLTDPNDLRIPELWQDKTLQQLLRQPLMGNYRIKGIYEKTIKNDPEAAKKLLEKALTLQEKMPTAGDAKMEEKLIGYLLNCWQKESAAE